MRTVTDTDRLNFLEKMARHTNESGIAPVALYLDDSRKVRSRPYPRQFICSVGIEGFGSSDEAGGVRAAIDRAMRNLDPAWAEEQPDSETDPSLCFEFTTAIRV